MFFRKKSNSKVIKCENCKSKLSEEYSFCPYCGNVLVDFERQAKDFGMLGKNDFVDDTMLRKQIADNNLSLTDKMLSTLMSSLMKSLDQQFREIDKSEIRNIPRGIKISIGVPGTPQKKYVKHDFPSKKITEEQLKKMSELPRETAKTNVKRIGDRIIYELDASGIESIKDIFVSKLESGYEIKALGKSKVYVNSLPINLPITSFSIGKDKLFVEFSSYE